jgi:hypothetical protein
VVWRPADSVWRRYGDQVSGFASASGSINTVLLVAIGDFDYTQLSLAAPFFTPVLFWVLVLVRRTAWGGGGARTRAHSTVWRKVWPCTTARKRRG